MLRSPRRLGVLGVAALAATALTATPAQAAPKRVVTLTPFQANTAAGLGVRPVGYGMTLGGADRFHSRLRAARKLPLSHPNGPNLEQLARLNPDLVLSSAGWSKGHAPMRQLGMRVVTVEPRKLSEVPAATRRVGSLLGRGAAARRTAIRQRDAIRRAGTKIKARPRVLLVLGVGSSPHAFLPTSWGGDVVRRAGGRLVDGGLRNRSGFAKISNEQIVAENPDVIIGVPHGNPEDAAKIAQNMRSNPAWSSTNAARTGRVHVSTGNSLLQAYPDAARTIRDVRRAYLKN